MEPNNVDEPPGAGAWAPGKVAELLGVSPVTLRSWSARYGIGPSAGGAGRHRRYSDADVRRLQHMQRLVGRGMPVREAAAVAFGGTAGGPVVPAAHRVRELEDAAADLRPASVAGLLDETVGTLGPAAAWTDVLAPVLRGLGGRWQRGDVCFATEWVLTSEISLALERYSRRFPAAVPGRPVLLACCPAERHSLPMEALRATLAEAGVPVAYAGQLVPAETLADLAARLDPVLVLLWSLAPPTADDLLAARVRDLGRAVGTAGPGWDHLGDRGFARVNDLASAVELAVAHAEA
ncbi:MerR family transcriptional regulator [Amycolatopsis australiensis]|uniref:DNA-binding transcriptional regulator, MerR family n=1 Tax=Amycolatopsis australiensis TaxID=546364 RepID=A0A1K1SI86_9PSEU|nr:MerR family transcriptional regulator [Amycolatopsis australiensis]SFW83621.1 DNA-binding transcriptional regulator, MerR family [Amycolatopsis australiensis]